jgi:hypothetical protein
MVATVCGLSTIMAFAAEAESFEYEGAKYRTAREACEAVAKVRRADKSVENPYGTVVEAKDAGDSFWCKLKDRTGNEIEQHYGSKVKNPPAKGQDPAGTAEPAGSDECKQIEALGGNDLQRAVTARLNQLVQATNRRFAANPSMAMDPGILSGNQVTMIFGGSAYRSNPQYMHKGKPAQTMSPEAPAAFNILYGHAIERLSARAAAADPCLPRYLQYVRNVDQTREGGQPDFRGVGRAAGLVIDVTTEEESRRKGAKYTFVTYQRLLRLDAQGLAVR